MTYVWVQVQQGSSLDSSLTYSSPNPHFNPAFGSLTFCQVLSGRRQRQIPLQLNWSLGLRVPFTPGDTCLAGLRLSPEAPWNEECRGELAFFETASHEFWFICDPSIIKWLQIILSRKSDKYLPRQHLSPRLKRYGSVSLSNGWAAS